MVRQNYKKSSGVKTPVSVWNLTNSMLAVIIILLLIILFAMFPVGAYRALSNTAEGNSGGGGSRSNEFTDCEYLSGWFNDPVARCSGAGYNDCAYAQYKVATRYFGSTNSSCNYATMQSLNYETYILGCEASIPSGLLCQNTATGAEPFRGDQEIAFVDWGVLCCK